MTQNEKMHLELERMIADHCFTFNIQSCQEGFFALPRSGSVKYPRWRNTVLMTYGPVSEIIHFSTLLLQAGMPDMFVRMKLDAMKKELIEKYEAMQGVEDGQEVSTEL